MLVAASHRDTRFEGSFLIVNFDLLADFATELREPSGIAGEIVGSDQRPRAVLQNFDLLFIRNCNTTAFR